MRIGLQYIQQRKLFGNQKTKKTNSSGCVCVCAACVYVSVYVILFQNVSQTFNFME